MTKFYVMIAALAAFCAIAIFGKSGLGLISVGAISAMTIAYFASRWADHKYATTPGDPTNGTTLQKLIATIAGIALEAVLAILGKLTPEFAIGITTVIGAYCNFSYQDLKWGSAAGGTPPIPPTV
jgi:hypothetical protein